MSVVITNNITGEQYTDDQMDVQTVIENPLLVFTQTTEERLIHVETTQTAIIEVLAEIAGVTL